MKLLDNIKELFGAKNAPEVRNVTYGQDIYEAFGVNPSSSGVTVNHLSALRVAAVYACVSKISGAISTLPLHIYKTDGDINERMPRDQLWYLLNEQPSQNYTAISHWENTSVNQLLRGDSFTWIRRNMAGNVRELFPLHRDWVFPNQEVSGRLRYYISIPHLNITTWVEPEDMLHFHGFGFDGVRSMSVIRYAAKSATGNAIAMDEYSGKFFANGSHPSVILKSPKVMTPDQQDALRKAYAQKYAGLDNAHRVPLVLTEGLEAQQISITAEDAQLIEARQFTVIDIARAFGVPPHLIGETSGSTSWGSGIESMGRAFVTYTLQTHLVRIEQELNRKLFPRDTGRFIKFDRDALIEGDSKAQSDYFRAALGGPGTGNGWMTVNEIRKTKGMAPIDTPEANTIFDPNRGATNENNATTE